jgi:hypothetical protein
LNYPSYTSRSYAIGAVQIFQLGWVVPTALPYNNNKSDTGALNSITSVQQGPGMDPQTGVYNAELVIQMSQLSAGLQAKLTNLPPVVGTLQIKTDGSSSVTINNSVLGSVPVSYMASESPGFSGASWQTYVQDPSFTLSAGPGVKTIYFKVKNRSGKESAVMNSTIVVS